MDVDSKLKFIESIVMPILLYGFEIWGFDNTCNVEKIQISMHEAGNVDSSGQILSPRLFITQ